MPKKMEQARVEDCFLRGSKMTSTQLRRQVGRSGLKLVVRSGHIIFFPSEANPKRPKIAWVFGKVSKVFTKWNRGYWVGAKKVGGGFKWFDGKEMD